MTSRRTFLQQTMMATAGLTLTGYKSWANAAESFPAFDLHAHPGAFFYKGTPGYPGDEALGKIIALMNATRLTGVFVSLVADAPLLEVTPTGIKPKGAYAPGDAAKEYQRQLTILKDLFKTLPVTVATKSSDLGRASLTKKVAVFLSCEGGEFLDGNPETLEKLYADGIRSVQLVHYAPSILGDLQTWTPEHNGLSDAGKAIVRKMNDLGMLIDVAHASMDTVKAVVDTTTKPIMLSHSILKMEDSRPIAARAISVDHAKLVAKTGGVIGAWPSGFNSSFDEFVDNTKRLIDAVGIDHVGLGTDMDANFKPVLSSYSQLPDWSSALLTKGFAREEVMKVVGGNARRVVKETIG